MRKTVKKAMAMLCTMALMAGTITGCGGSSGSTTAKDDGKAAASTTSAEVSQKGQEGEPTSIDVVFHTLETSTYPFQPQSPAYLSFEYYVFETLFVQAQDGSGPEPLVASEYVQADDEGYVWDVTIKDYVYDSAGNHITVDDVIWSLNEQKNSGNWSKFYFSKMTNAEALDDHTVRITMDDNGFGIIEILLTNAFVISQKAFEESGDEMATKAIGTGRYVIDEFVSGSSLSMSVNENYWEKDESKLSWVSHANVDKITCHYVTENNQREVALESGTADIVNYISASSKEMFAGNDKFGVYETEDLNASLLLLSCGPDSPCKDLKVRQAIAYGIDQQTVIDVAFDGAGSISQNSIENAGDFNPEWKNTEFYPYNPEKAKELLAEAGYAPGECHLRMMFAAAGKARGELIQTMLNAVGFDVELVQYESALYLSYVNDPTQYELALINEGSTYNSVYYGILYDQGNHNGTTAQGLKDDNLQALIDKASDREHTQEDVDNLFYYINENVLNTPLSRMHTITMYNKECGLEEFVMTNGGVRLYNCCTYSWNH